MNSHYRLAAAATPVQVGTDTPDGVNVAPAVNGTAKPTLSEQVFRWIVAGDRASAWFAVTQAVCWCGAFGAIFAVLGILSPVCP